MLSSNSYLLVYNSQRLRRSPEWRHWCRRLCLRVSGGPHSTPRILTVCFSFIELLGEVLKANIFIAHALGHDAVVESDVRVSTTLFVDLKSLRCFVAYVETLGIPLWRQEYVILNARVHGLGKGGIERDGYCSVVQRAGAEILKPVFRRLHGIERDFPHAVVHRGRVANLAAAGQVAANINCACSAEETSDGRDDRRRVARLCIVLHQNRR